MTVDDIMQELEACGSEQIKKILLKHGVREPLYGVKVEDLKRIQKKIKKDYELAKDLYKTGNADAMYLAGLIADDDKMTAEELDEWVRRATSANISEYTVPWVAGGSRYGMQLGMKWIAAPEEHIATAGWATLSGLVSVTPDEQLDLNTLQQLLTRIAQQIAASPNRVRYQMNNYIICVGAYVTSLTDDALATTAKVGKVNVEMNGTACKVPDAAEYIAKIAAKGNLGKKKKMLKC
jgi:3-methyladenine DNA glycosylase AlkD